VKVLVGLVGVFVAGKTLKRIMDAGGRWRRRGGEAVLATGATKHADEFEGFARITSVGLNTSDKRTFVFLQPGAADGEERSV
jgi:hypothetical protein